MHIPPRETCIIKAEPMLVVSLRGEARLGCSWGNAILKSPYVA